MRILLLSFIPCQLSMYSYSASSWNAIVEDLVIWTSHVHAFKIYPIRQLGWKPREGIDAFLELTRNHSWESVAEPGERKHGKHCRPIPVYLPPPPMPESTWLASGRQEVSKLDHLGPRNTSMWEFWELWCSFGMRCPDNRLVSPLCCPPSARIFLKWLGFMFFVFSFQSWEMEMWRGISLVSSFCVVCEQAGSVFLLGFILQRSTAH